MQMDQTNNSTAPIQTGTSRTANESVYQIAIIVAALLLVISASLF
jgi:hypothetical protein